MNIRSKARLKALSENKKMNINFQNGYLKIRIITRIVMMMTLLCFIAAHGVAHLSLPAPNTTANITFRDFEWYADYNAIKKQAKKNGFSKGYDSFEFGLTWDAPHWNYIISQVGARTKIENCGGNIMYYTVPDVAGHSVYSATLYFITSPELGGIKKYKKTGVSSFYMATYEIRTEKDPDCYKDLAEKLKRIYGDSPEEKENYMCWVNQNGAAILLGIMSSDDVGLAYIAPEAEKRLSAVEQYLLEQDALNNPQIYAPTDDLSGL